LTLLLLVGAFKEIRIAPFDDVVSFFVTYKLDWEARGMPEEMRANLSTFNKAFGELSLNEGYKKMNAKGHMNTCEICNNAKELLNNKRKF
jgi:hypothetical protein